MGNKKRQKRKALKNKKPRLKSGLWYCYQQTTIAATSPGQGLYATTTDC